MLTIEISSGELWDEVNEQFIKTKPMTITLEHSLVSLSKWESKWHIPFIGNKDLTDEMVLDYIKMMTTTKNVPDEIYLQLTSADFEKINAYIEDPMTATTFRNEGPATSNQIVTSEIIYWQMIACQIPMECQRWHLNRLLCLIKVCSLKNNPGKKMSKNEIMSRNRELNAQRRAALNSKG